MKKTLFLLFSAILFTACAHTEVEKTTNTKDVLCLSKKCAVYITITAKEIDQMKREKGEEDFYTIADDANWYFSESSDYLKANNYEIIGIDSTESRKLVFVKANGDNVEIDRTKMNIGFWTYILFNGIDDPVVAKPIEVESRFSEYIKK